jgi:hypothetical protein
MKTMLHQLMRIASAIMELTVLMRFQRTLD